MKFIIKIEYSTRGMWGDREMTSTIIDYKWSNLDIARENIKWIKEHYDFLEKFEYDLYRKNYHETIKPIIDEYRKRPWFVYDERPYIISADHITDEDKVHRFPNDIEYRYDPSKSSRFRFMLDDGTFGEDYSSWNGYHEQLRSIRVELDEPGLVIEL